MQGAISVLRLNRILDCNTLVYEKGYINFISDEIVITIISFDNHYFFFKELIQYTKHSIFIFLHFLNIHVYSCFVLIGNEQ